MQLSPKYFNRLIGQIGETLSLQRVALSVDGTQLDGSSVKVLISKIPEMEELAFLLIRWKDTPFSKTATKGKGLLGELERELRKEGLIVKDCGINGVIALRT